MDKPTYRTMNFCCVPIFVENTSDYKKQFVIAAIGENSAKTPEIFKSNECEPIHLFKVLLPDDTAKYVLACNEERAISQACCGHDLEYKEKLEKKCFAIRVPFRIQGWSTEEV